MKIATQSHLPARLSKNERQEQLLKCAITAYARTGVERTGHADVAKLAGVSTATVFNYFPTREALTEAVFGFLRSAIFRFIDKLPESSQTGSKQLLSIVEHYKDLTPFQSDVVKVYLNWSVAFSPDVRQKFLEFQDQALTSLTEKMSGPSDDRSDAKLLVAAASMYSHMKLDNTDAETIQRFVDRVSDAFT